MIDEKQIDNLREYLKNHYIPVLESPKRVMGAMKSESDLSCEESDSVCYHSYAAPAPIKLKKTLFLGYVSSEASDYIKKNRKPGGFAYALEQKRKDKGLKPAELYKKANVDRRLYSRLMGPEGRNPSKNTVISFAFALRLSRQEFNELLQTAGYSLSNSSSRDVCVMYCLEKGIYSIDDVNALLFAVGIEPLTRDVA